MKLGLVMEKFINQFRRLYDDRGESDKDFTEAETRLREAQERLVGATNELVKSSDKLNAAAMAAYSMGHNKH